jgi:hypothetical protein
MEALAAQGPGAAELALLALLPVLVIFAILATLAARAAQRKRRDAMFEAARPYGGRLAPGSYLGFDRIDLAMNGVSGCLSTSPGAKNTPPRTRLDFAVHAAGRLRVTPQGAMLGLRKFFGAQDLQVGDAAFDPAFQIESSPPEFAKAVLTDAARGALLGLRPYNVAFEALPGRVILEVRALLAPDVAKIAFFLQSGAALLAAVGASSGEGAAAPVDPDRCPTCGSPFDSLSVSCAHCGARQHLDCWGHVGGCAAYGCGGRRFRR